jgi:hypothetical protein
MTNPAGTSGSGGIPVAGAAAASGAFDDRGDEQQTDQGVPVGRADVEADRERASGDGDADDGEDATDGLTGVAGSTDAETDDGVPVGSADAEEDRRRAAAAGDEPDDAP